VTVLVYLPYLPRTPALLFFFCLVPFGGATQMPVLSCRFQTLQLIVISLSLYASINYIILNLVPFSLSISLAHFDHLNDGQSFSQSPSSNCVHYKVYFILHFIVYFLLLLFFSTYVPMILVKSPTSFRIFFLVLPHSPNIVTLFVRTFHQHLFICIHFLFFFLARICYWYSRVT